VGKLPAPVEAGMRGSNGNRERLPRRIRLRPTSLRELSSDVTLLHSGRWIVVARPLLGRPPFDPVTIGVGLPFLPQQVLAQRPHDEAGRHHGAEEHQGRHDRIHHLMQQQPDLEPELIERL
jgi:hypothetical protein